MHKIQLRGRGRVDVVEQYAEQHELDEDGVEGLTEFSLVSPGTEMQVIADPDPSPRGIGYATVFTVTRVGAGVRDVRAGDIVFAMGNHARLQRFSRRDVVLVPADLAPETAVFARLMAVAWTTLATTKVHPGSQVLVTGLGIIGNLAAQIFAAAGYDVTAVDPDPQRRSLGELAGLPRVLDTVPALSDEDGFRLALDCSGHEGAVLQACNSMARGGEVVLVGVPWQARTFISAHEITHIVFHRMLTLRSGWEWTQPRYSNTLIPGASTMESISDALRWLKAGRVRVDGLADVADPLRAPEAYARLHESSRLTVMFDWRRDV